MAEGILKSFDPDLNVVSAGTNPAFGVHAKAITVMHDIGIDISDAYAKDVSRFLSDSFDYVVTVCDHARETCPVFSGSVEHVLHIGFDDPAEARGSDEKVLQVFREIRDEIREKFLKFYQDNLAN